jgi:membrane fusion protein
LTTHRTELPLFRPEVGRARSGSPLGTIVIGRPLSARVMSLAGLGILAALLLLAFFGSYARTVRLTGVLTPAEGVVRIQAPRRGQISEVLVQEGMRVERGQPLLVIAMPEESRGGETVEQVLRALTAQQASLRAEREQRAALARIERAGLERRIGELRHQSESLAREGLLLDERVQRARRIVGDHEKLAQLGLVSATAVREKQDLLAELLARGLALERSRTQLSGEIAALGAELDAAPLTTATRTAELERASLEIDQRLREKESLRDVLVRAPVGGMATAVLAHTGHSVDASAPLLSIVPSGAALEAHLVAPSRAIANVKPGQSVKLRYDAFPHQKFGHAKGRVMSVSRAAVSSEGESGYRVVVRLESQTMGGEPLLPDMRLEADIELERRRLIEWLIGPIHESLFDRG